MYIGIDFLIDRGKELYLSEINTGAPAGAFEYDLVYRQQFEKPSGIFERIDRISKDNFSLDFKDYIRSLPYIDDLKRLKIWMDGRGAFPEKPAPELKLEDKWIQYKLLSPLINMLPTELFDENNKDFLETCFPGVRKFVIKRRLGRNGRGLRVLDKDAVNNLENPAGSHIVQPWIDSSVSGFTMSIRASAFCGEYICMFASLSSREVSNHGYRFYIEPGEKFGLSSEKFKVNEVVKKSWEAEILFGDNIPPYLKESVSVESIADGKLILPQDIYEKIIEASVKISDKISNIDCSSIKDSLFDN